MKSQAFLSTLGAVSLLALCSGHAAAGSLTIETGPSFLPNSSFTDNTIEAELLHNPGGLNGDVVRLLGDAMVSPAAEPPQILIGGNFTASSNDLFSVVYDFVINLNTPQPITLTIEAQTIVSGVQQTFNSMLVITPGIGHYQGQIAGPLFALATSGTWSGHLYFDLTTPSEKGTSTDNPDPGNLLVKLRAVDFQLVAVPEPSSVATLLLGLGLIAGLALRRRQLA